MNRKFVLVTATYTNEAWRDVTAAGIRRLKRGVSIKQFITDFLVERGLDESEVLTLQRDDTYTVLHVDRTLEQNDEGPVRGCTSLNFTEYDEDDLFSAVAHLSREELLRDLKELLPLKGLT